MSDNYRDLATIFDPDLHLPISGVRYTVRAPSKDEGDALRALLAGGVDAWDERLAFEALLGPALAEMVANGVPDPLISHAGRTAVLHYALGPQVGAVHWQLGVLGTSYSVADLLSRLREPHTPAAPSEAPG